MNPAVTGILVRYPDDFVASMDSRKRKWNKSGKIGPSFYAKFKGAMECFLIAKGENFGLLKL